MKKLILSITLFAFLFPACKHDNEKQNEKKSIPYDLSQCVFLRNEKNSIGKLIKVLEKKKFMAIPFSDTSAKEYFHDNDFLKGYLSCVRVDTVMGIYFDFKIYSEDAFQIYGGIKKDNKISFTLNSGKTIALTFAKTFSGNTNLTKELTEYSSFVRLPKEIALLLKDEEITAVHIEWAKIKESYSVENPAVFMKQIPCIE
ncbi:MAG: hypothetical protein V1781_09825 [Bacteroidota bacterium]